MEIFSGARLEKSEPAKGCSGMTPHSQVPPDWALTPVPLGCSAQTTPEVAGDQGASSLLRLSFEGRLAGGLVDHFPLSTITTLQATTFAFIKPGISTSKRQKRPDHS